MDSATVTEFEAGLDAYMVEWEAGVRAHLATQNAFCPTGEGGGVDPTCSPVQARGGVPRPASTEEALAADPRGVLYGVIDKSNGSVEELRQAQRTVDRMPEKAAKAIAANLKTVKFVDDENMAAECNKLIGGREYLPGMKPPMGLYHSGKKAALIHSGEKDESENVAEKPVGTLQHEMGHALDKGVGMAMKVERDAMFDAPKLEFAALQAKYSEKYSTSSAYSDQPRWIKAWQKEIASGGLSRYATEDRAEGFAEFHRLVCHLRDHDKSFDEAEKRLPKCFAFWREHELL